MYKILLTDEKVSPSHRIYVAEAIAYRLLAISTTAPLILK